MPSTPPPDRFTWHPTYAGRRVSDLRTELRRDLGQDQRSYALIMAGAEEHEGQVLASVIPMERRWGGFDLDWAEAAPDALVETMIAFELEREARQELFPFAEYRARAAPTLPDAPSGQPWWRKLLGG